MKTTFNKIEGDVEINNDFANNLLKAEIKKYNDRISEGVEYDLSNFDFSDSSVFERNKKIKEENKKFLIEQFNAEGWIYDDPNDALSNFSFVGFNLRFDFKPKKDLGFDALGDVCTNVVGEVEISLK